MTKQVSLMKWDVRRVASKHAESCVMTYFTFHHHVDCITFLEGTMK
jgi:hypothetical protein